MNAVTPNDRYFYSIEIEIKADDKYNKGIEENIFEEMIFNSFTNECFSVLFTAAESEDGNHIVRVQRKSLSQDEHIAYEFCFMIKKNDASSPNIGGAILQCFIPRNLAKKSKLQRKKILI